MVAGSARIVLVFVLAAALGACGGGGGRAECGPDLPCPAGTLCIDGRCQPAADAADGDADADAADGDAPVEGADADSEVIPDAPAALRTGFTLPGGAISGDNGTYRYQFSVGAPQPMGSGASAEGTWTFGPGAAHRR